jgi:hypothetical protein
MSIIKYGDLTLCVGEPPNCIGLETIEELGRPPVDVFYVAGSQPKTPRDERRLRILNVPYDVLGIILGQWQNCRNVMLPEYKGLPDDVKIEGVGESFGRRAFQLLLSSRQFDPVPDGAEIPPVCPLWSDKMIVFHRIQNAGFVPAIIPSDDEPDCPDCKGTREYRGLNGIEPCRTCCPST